LTIKLIKQIAKKCWWVNPSRTRLTSELSEMDWV